MKKLNRYIGRHMCQGVVTTMIVLLALEYVFSFAQEAKMIGVGDYGFVDVIGQMVLSTPGRIYQMFPASALLGTLMGLSMLATRSELVAMRAAGVSRSAITRSVLKTGVILAILAWVLGEVVAPQTERIAQNRRAYALSGGQAVQTALGTWMRDGLNFIHVRKVAFDGTLLGVTIYHFNDEMHLVKAQFADSAHYQGGSWTLKDVQQTQFNVMRLKTARFEEIEWPTTIRPDVWEVIDSRHLDEMSLKGLWRNLQYRRDNGLDYIGYELAIWQKIMQPLQTLVMIFIAVPFVFGPLRSASIGLKLMAGILAGFGFHTAYEIITNMSLVSGVPPALGATLPLFAFAIVGLILLRRAQ